jgi:hypothetical protein
MYAKNKTVNYFIISHSVLFFLFPKPNSVNPAAASVTSKKALLKYFFECGPQKIDMVLKETIFSTFNILYLSEQSFV